MNAPKVGDRVHVEFDGTVQDITEGVDFATVKVNDGRPGAFVQSVHPMHCTVIVPPIKVGDVVGGAQLDALPNDSIVARPTDIPLNKIRGVWCVGIRAHDCMDSGYVVLRIGGGS